MTEYFRIEGLYDISFDEGATGPYRLTQGRPPRDISRPMSRAEILVQLRQLPLGVRGHALNRGMSMCSFPFNVQGENDAEMEQALQELVRTLNDGELWIETQAKRGTKARVRYKANNAVENSYKTIYYGYVAEAAGRDVLGSRAKESYLQNMQLTVFMEPMWRPSHAYLLGLNEIYCPGFEEDGNADGLADNWTLLNAPVVAMTLLYQLQGHYSQGINTNAANEGIVSTTVVPAVGTTNAAGYFWVYRRMGTSDVRAVLRDTTAGVDRATADWSAATVTMEDASGNEWRRLDLIANGTIVAGNNHQLQIYSTGVANTTFYADMAYLEWNKTTIDDEWADHWLVYNHYDTTEGAVHEGHQNYYDVAGLKGTDEARVMIRVETYQQADENWLADLIMGRRTWWEEPCGVLTTETHWLEAEDAINASNWAAVGGVPRCSAGDCVSDGANVTGYREWQFLVNPLGVRIESQQIRGRYDVFGMVYTDDEAHTQYRLSYSNFSGTLYFYNRWVKQPNASTWQMVYLGEVNLEKCTILAIGLGTCYIRVEYLKDAADTVQLDCIWLVRKDEPETRLHTVDGDFLDTTLAEQCYFFARDQEFDIEEKENVTVASGSMSAGELCLQGDQMTLSPHKDNRIYVCVESADPGPPIVRSYEAHGVANPLQLKVWCWYLPQYQTPLD